MGTTSSPRIYTFDVAKGIGILLVIFAHINYTPVIIDTIYSFHMPLFFILSGILYDKIKYKNFSIFIKRKLQTLICPYILIYLIALFYIHCSQILVLGFDSFDIKMFAFDFLQMFLSQGSANVVSAPLWFVLCLFIVEILYYFISKLNVKLSFIVTAVLVCFGWLLESDIIPFDNTLLPWSLDSALFALGFFFIGNQLSEIIKITIQKLKTMKYKKIVLVVIFILSISIIIPLALYNGHVSLGSKILNNGFIFYLTGIIGTIGIISLSIMLEKSKFLRYCGRNSLYIMGIHCLIRNTIYSAHSVLGIPLYDKYNFVQTLIPFIIVVFLSLVFVLIYNKLKEVLLHGFQKKVYKKG